jgi:hypothetical protein
MTFRILTVGDGDLSCSLALVRAYGSQVHVVASTLLSRENLLSTYPNTAPENLKELDPPHVLFGIDATMLHQQLAADEDHRFDAVLFHHPHLGIYWEDEEEHARRHMTLISHYLDSARRILRPGGAVHVCLCGNQAHSWKLEKICERLQLVVTDSVCATRPLFRKLPTNEPYTDWKAPRRYRNGKLGSKHWLSNYGYRHQLTFPRSGNEMRCMNVTASMHYFIKTAPINTQQLIKSDSLLQAKFACNVCTMSFVTLQDLDDHLNSPTISLGRSQSYRSNSDKGLTIQETKNLTVNRNKTPVLSIEQRKDNILTVNEQHGDGGDNEYQQIRVADEFSGKRLRWFLHQVVQLGSKRKCEQMIKDGNVLLQGRAMEDSGRILAKGDEISIVPSSGANAVPASALIRQFGAWSNGMVVVWKPVGVRAAGMFDSMSLESQYCRQAGKSYVPVSRLDRGCGGLVLLQERSVVAAAAVSRCSIALSFTVLVHGQVPIKWTSGLTDTLPVDAIRSWKRTNSSTVATDEPAAADNKATIVLLEQTAPVGTIIPALSTLRVTTNCRSSGLASILSFYLRKTHNFPVVGDRFASDEYSQLPRSMRQRVKQRLCMSCTELRLGSSGEHASVPIPSKWSAKHWQNVLSASSKNK